MPFTAAQLTDESMVPDMYSGCQTMYTAKACGTGDCKMYATAHREGSDCSLIVVSLTTENNRIIHIRKAVASLFCCKHSAQQI